MDTHHHTWAQPLRILGWVVAIALLIFSMLTGFWILLIVPIGLFAWMARGMTGGTRTPR